MAQLKPYRMARLALPMAVVVAVALRGSGIGDLSLGHFDEGVLVSGAFGVWLHGLWHFPLAQPLVSPPLFPWMIAGTFAVTQTASPMMAIYLSAALGSATVFVYSIVLRRLYGEAPALAGAALLAASDLHVAFSRMALTDAALTFWFVVGACFLTRLVESAERLRQQPGRRAAVTVALWGLGLGLATGAAWNTKYNGWMLVAIAGTAWLFVAGRQLFCGRGAKGAGDSSEGFSSLPALMAISLAAAVAIACFVPWYLHVQRTFSGGYAAVTANHLSYVGGVADWPSRAARLWLSLTALRHVGWLATLASIAFVMTWSMFRSRHHDRRADSRAFEPWTLLVGFTALTATFVFGGDAVVGILAAFAIGPALVWGRWPQVLFAVWAAAFLVTAPFYHPYTRLLLPAWPATIGLAVWLVEVAIGVEQKPGEANGIRVATKAARHTARMFLAIISGGLALAALVWQPCGWLPSAGAWERWSTRQSFRALGDAVAQRDLPANALVLCQGPPAMTLYLNREWAPLEIVPFQLWMSRIDRDRPCYLAIDSWGMYAENHQLAREAVVERLACLEPVVVVANDLNLVTLLDYLPAPQVARQVAQPWPPKHLIDAGGREMVAPAALDEPYASVIVLYRIDRDCIDLLDNSHRNALQ
ncbi:MAG TPA: phospholipid carrier-dependent glycosyltransferase [Pirellulales bacterium]|nr:phospholipid carrier-dependent glycosyltransferase [Pirellulales bacterium]